MGQTKQSNGPFPAYLRSEARIHLSRRVICNIDSHHLCPSVGRAEPTPTILLPTTAIAMPRTRWRASPGEPGGACKQYLHLLGLDTEPHQVLAGSVRGAGSWLTAATAPRRRQPSGEGCPSDGGFLPHREAQPLRPIAGRYPNPCLLDRYVELEMPLHENGGPGLTCIIRTQAVDRSQRRR